MTYTEKEIDDFCDELKKKIKKLHIQKEHCLIYNLSYQLQETHDQNYFKEYTYTGNEIILIGLAPKGIHPLIDEKFKEIAKHL